MVVGAGFEPAKLSRQIYSLIPLAAREPHRTLRHFNEKTFNVKPMFSMMFYNFQSIVLLSDFMSISSAADLLLPCSLSAK